MYDVNIIEKREKRKGNRRRRRKRWRDGEVNVGQ